MTPSDSPQQQPAEERPSEARREADAAFQQSLAQLETLIDPPERPPETCTEVPAPSEDEAQWEAAGADLEEFLDADEDNPA
ncbi:MAG: hypothetical protein ACPGVO_14230 [Spirulinaceae cyanobacterium]